MTLSNWFADVNAFGVRRVAAALGLTVHERRGHGIGPCPGCTAERRHPSKGDKRLAIGVRDDDKGWRCMECDVHGDPVALAALVVAGAVKPTSFADVRRRCAEVGLCEPDDRDSRPFVTRPRLQPPSPRPPSPPRRPPLSEVLDLWSACVHVLDDAEVAGWLRSRGLNPADVADRNLARALPGGTQVPRWARGPDGAWNRTDHRCLVPLYDENGELVSLRARAVTQASGRKSLAPAGFETRGLVFAEACARQMLKGNLAPLKWLVISEGEPAYLAGVLAFSDADEDAPAVLGIESGAWTDAIASRIPDGLKVVLDVDADEQGEKYANQVIDSLTARCDVRDARSAK